MLFYRFDILNKNAHLIFFNLSFIHISEDKNNQPKT